MTQIRGTAGYHLGNQSPFGGTSRSDATTSDPNPLDALREQTSKVEDFLDTVSDPIKPYLPAIGRFLIVVTFLEDALRILTQWGDQLVYLNQYRHSMSHFFVRGHNMRWARKKGERHDQLCDQSQQLYLRHMKHIKLTDLPQYHAA